MNGSPDPFECPQVSDAGAATFEPSPIADPAETVRDRLHEDVRARCKLLETELSALQAAHENLLVDRNELQQVLDGYGEHEPPVVRGALDAQQQAEARRWAEQERASSLERELVNARQLQAHATAAAALSRAALGRALANFTEIAKRLGVSADDDGAQIVRAIGLLVTRSVVLDQVLDDTLDRMSRPAKAMLTDDQPNFARANRVTGELQAAGAMVVDDEGHWNWTIVGEALRERRREHLGSQRRTGEYKAPQT